MRKNETKERNKRDVVSTIYRVLEPKSVPEEIDRPQDAVSPAAGPGRRDMHSHAYANSLTKRNGVQDSDAQ